MVFLQFNSYHQLFFRWLPKEITSPPPWPTTLYVGVFFFLFFLASGVCVCVFLGFSFRKKCSFTYLLVWGTLQCFRPKGLKNLWRWRLAQGGFRIECFSIRFCSLHFFSGLCLCWQQLTPLMEKPNAQP